MATAIGAICVRLKEIYFAFVTLAFQMLIHSTILSWVSFTGGDQGLRGGIPRPPFLGIDLSNPLHLYITSCALLVIGLLLMRQIAQSPFGYTLRMIRDNATRASFIGIDEISGTISSISRIAGAIFEAVDQQNAATREVTSGIQVAAAGSSNVATNIVKVSKGAENTGHAAAEIGRAHV